MKRLLAGIVILAFCGLALGQTVWKSGTVLYNLTYGTSGGGGGSDLPKDSNQNATTGSNQIASAAGTVYQGTFFTAGSSYTAHSVKARLIKVASPTMTLTLFLYTDAGGSSGPGTVLTGGTSGTVSASSCPTSEGDVQFTGLTATITSGTKYWIVIKGSAVDSVNFAAWAFDTLSSDPNGRTKKSANGTSWNNVSNGQSGKFTVYGQ